MEWEKIPKVEERTLTQFATDDKCIRQEMQDCLQAYIRAEHLALEQRRKREKCHPGV